MKKKLFFLVTALISVLLSCMNEPKSKPATITFESISIKDSIGNCEERNCFDLKVQYLKAKEDNPIAKTISDSLAVYTSMAIADGLTDSVIVMNDVKEAAKLVRTLYDQDNKMKEDEQFYTIISNEISTQELYRNNKVLCIRQDIYRYMGGAHPLTTISLYTFDIRTGKTIQLKDIVLDQDKFTAIVEKYLKKEHEIPANQSLQEAGFLFEGLETLPLPIDFSVKDNELQLIYNQYEIAAYAMGISSLSIPFSELDKVINIDRIK